MKKFLKEYKFVWISYLVLFVIELIHVLIASEDTIISGWSKSTYANILVVWGDLYGFVLGAYIQYKARDGWIKILIKTVICFIGLIVLVLIPTLRSELRDIFFSSVIFELLPYIVVISCCFFIAQSAVKIVRAFKKGSTFVWDSYVSLLFLMLIGVLFSYDVNIMYPWGFLFYLPFLVAGAYIYSLVFGIQLQRKRNNGWIKILLTAMLHFTCLLFLLFLPTLDGVIKNGIDYYKPIYTFAPAGLSAFCFLLGEVIVKVKGITKNKQKSV